MKTRSLLAALVLLVVAAPGWADCGACGKGAQSTGEHSHAHAVVGKAAPAFALTDVDGTEYKLSEMKGKIVVLEWTNHECPVVNKCQNKGAMSKTLAKFEGKPVVWMAIDSSHFAPKKLAEIRSWVSKVKITYPYLIDEGGKVGHIYAAKTTPHMFVIDQKGVLAYAGAIDNEPYGEEKKTRNYVEEAVTALLTGSAVATSETKPYGCSVKYKG